VLKEMRLDDLPERKAWGAELSEDGQFASDMLDEFIESSAMLVEVTGWPSGDPHNGKQAARLSGMLTRQIEKRKIANINALIRSNRVFLQKTIVKKIGEQNG